MKSKVGLWIDGKHAFIVFLGDEIKQQNSDCKKHLSYSSRVEARKIAAESELKSQLTPDLDHYYDVIVSQIVNAESIYMFGSQKAKNELKCRLTLKKLANDDMQEFAWAS